MLPSTTQKVLLFFGERLAIILFFMFVLFLFFSGNIPQVLSKQEDPQIVKTNSTWYQNTQFSVPEKTSNNETFEISSVVVTPTPTPTPEPVNATGDDVWLKLADCESHQNWADNTGNGYYGGLQFSQGAWESAGGSGLPSDAGRDEQIMRGKLLQSKRGWGPWNACSKKLGLL